MPAAQKTETGFLSSKSSWATALMRFSIAVANTKSNTGRKKMFLPHRLVYHRGKSERQFKWGRSWGQELMQRPWTDVAYWLAPHGLHNLLSFSTQDHQPGVAPPTVGWTFHTNHYRFACRQTSWRRFSIESSSSQMTLACVKP